MREFLYRRWHRLRAKAPAEVPPLRPISLLESDALVGEIVATRSRLERILFDNIIPFWLRCIDEDAGGYLVNHDERGVWQGPCEKHAIPQTRTCWFFARVAALPNAPAAALPAARHGYEFLRDRLWDREHGGIFWTLDPAGRQPVNDEKRLYAQVFGLYALSEFAAVSADASALALAGDSFNILEERLHDGRYGGYRPQATRSWQVPADSPESWVHKTVNDHLHVLEALIRFAMVSPDPGVMSRLIETTLILTSAVVRKASGAITDRHRPDWTPLLDRANAHVSYGHDLEAAWLVLEACTVAGIPQALVIDWARTLADHALEWGVDRSEGGVYLAGPLGGPAHSRDKIWWVQAEALVGALALYRVTGESRYADLYLRTLDRIERLYVDWELGDWHVAVPRSRQFGSDKAGVWKSPYHNGRSMMKCIELLTPGSP